MADDNGMGGRGGLAGAQHWQNIGVREDPAREVTVLSCCSQPCIFPALPSGGCLAPTSLCSPCGLPSQPPTPGMVPTLRGLVSFGEDEDAATYRSFGYSSLKSRLFRVVQSRIFSNLTTMSLPCQRPFHS